MLFLRDGWTEFVNAYSLEENDILIFKYNGNSCFSILIFDRGSLCEKESSYFIKKCGHSRHGNKNQKGFLKDILEEFTQEYSYEELKLGPLKKPRKLNDEQNLISVEQITSDIPETSHMKATCIDVETAKERPGDQQKSRSSELVNPPYEQCIASDVHKRSLTAAHYIDVEAPEERPRNQLKSWSWQPVNLPRVPEKQKPPMKVLSINVAALCSKRAISEEQKQATLHMARKQLTADSFLAVMRPSSASRPYYLNIPAAWMSQHITLKTQLVQLRRNEKTWATKLQCRPNGRAGLAVGWKEFVLDNYLEEFDVCVFKLASQKHEAVILDVSIFRVVPDAAKSMEEHPAPTNKPPDVGVMRKFSSGIAV